MVAFSVGVKMQRIADFDVTSRYSGGFAKLAVQAAFATGCAAVFVAGRSLLDAVAPGAGPYAFIFPFVLIATLYGHWRAGVMTLILCLLWNWMMVLPSTAGTTTDKVLRLALNAASASILIFLAEAFRRAVRFAAAERDRQVAYSQMLHRELDHQTKNNLQLMQSLLQLQMREETNSPAKAALSLALRRLSNFTTIYARFPTSSPEVQAVHMRSYLGQLVGEVATAIFGANIHVETRFADIALPRETALAIGLYVNEALTNCAKYAFNNGLPGKVAVILDGTADHWTLQISDDGSGAPDAPSPSGMGSALMEAFAQQAGAEHHQDYPERGCTVRLVRSGG